MVVVCPTISNDPVEGVSTGPLPKGEREKCYLSIGVVFQVPDQAGAEFPDIGLDLAEVFSEGVQLGDDDLITGGLTVTVAPGDQRPGHDADQDSDGADELTDFC